MTIADMHYDFKMKLNKVDSQQNKGFLIPEIDWVLNEAQELFVKIVAEPRVKSPLGFEINQRSIDDISPLVKNEVCLNVNNDNTVTLPDDYWHFIKGDVNITNEKCGSVKARFYLRQHDDEFELSPFDRSSYDWRCVNGVFFNNGVKFYTDNTFSISEFCISYIKKLNFIHFAEGYLTDGYELASGVRLTGSQDCELPEHTHREIVDIAVLIVTGQIDIKDYQIKFNKLSLNNLK